MGIAIISTSKGIMTDKSARNVGVGGEALAFYLVEYILIIRDYLFLKRVYYSLVILRTGGIDVSRIGKMPVEIPNDVNINISNDNIVTVKGPKGTLTKGFHKDMIIEVEDGKIVVKRNIDDKFNKSLHGLTRSLINNMVVGVTKGFEKALDISGVGYRAQKQGKKIVINLGYSHPVEIEEPEGITIDVPAPNKIIVKAVISKQ